MARHWFDRVRRHLGPPSSMDMDSKECWSVGTPSRGPHIKLHSGATRAASRASTMDLTCVFFLWWTLRGIIQAIAVMCHADQHKRPKILLTSLDIHGPSSTHLYWAPLHCWKDLLLAGPARLWPRLPESLPPWHPACAPRRAGPGSLTLLAGHRACGGRANAAAAAGSRAQGGCLCGALWVSWWGRVGGGSGEDVLRI